MVTIFQRINSKTFPKDDLRNSFVLGTKNEFEKGQKTVFFACKKTEIASWQKDGYRIIAITPFSFSLDFDFCGMTVENESVDVAFSARFRVIPNDELANFILSHPNDESYTDETLKEDLLSRRFYLEGFIRQILADSKLNMLSTYGKNAVDWSVIKSELPGWLMIEHIESLQVTAGSPAIQKKAAAAASNVNDELDSLNKKLKAIEEETRIAAAEAKKKELLDNVKHNEYLRKNTFSTEKTEIRFKKMNRGLKRLGAVFLILIVILIAYGWIYSDYLPCRVGLVIEGIDNAKALYENTIAPELKGLLTRNQALYRTGDTTAQIECVVMSKEERLAFAKVLDDWAKGKDYIDWTGGEPEYSFDGGIEVFLKKSTYRLVITPQKTEKISIYIVGGDNKLMIEINEFLKDQDSNLVPEKVLYEGRDAIKYSLAMSASNITKHIIPFMTKEYSANNSEFDPLSSSIVFYLQEKSEWYAIDFTGINDLSRKTEAKKVFGPSHLDIISNQKYSPEGITKKQNMLLEKGFTFTSEKVTDSKRTLIVLKVTEAPREIKVNIFGEMDNQEALKTVLEAFSGNAVKIINRGTVIDGTLQLTVQYRTASDLTAVSEDLSKCSDISMKNGNLANIEILPQNETVTVDISALLAHPDKLKYVEQIFQGGKSTDGKKIICQLPVKEITAKREIIRQAGFIENYSVSGKQHNIILNPPQLKTDMIIYGDLTNQNALSVLLKNFSGMAVGNPETLSDGTLKQTVAYFDEAELKTVFDSLNHPSLHITSRKPVRIELLPVTALVTVDLSALKNHPDKNKIEQLFPGTKSANGETISGRIAVRDIAALREAIRQADFVENYSVSGENHKIKITPQEYIFTYEIRIGYQQDYEELKKAFVDTELYTVKKQTKPIENQRLNYTFVRLTVSSIINDAGKITDAIHAELQNYDGNFRKSSILPLTK